MHVVLAGIYWDGFQVFRASVQITYNPNGDSSHIITLGKITEVNYNQEYIEAKQLELKDDINTVSTVKVPDETDVKYWVIDKSSLITWGPLKHDRYQQKMDELGIHLNLLPIGELK
ncbi:DUF3997 domain-containing protein [Rossellomorea aquimaris]|uniref:DUF3997 domain-containing protein n=1 Tax=Rossellomorea aquimaris TaxID=189382 RepID=UPI001CD1E4A7|nr:DUF3997 domain-containing protein [Rossellomorea aquimaris]MCA1061408.1 DUF3997 domain-containing protein [Rossellomorea aquimaris]